VEGDSVALRDGGGGKQFTFLAHPWKSCRNSSVAARSIIIRKVVGSNLTVTTLLFLCKSISSFMARCSSLLQDFRFIIHTLQLYFGSSAQCSGLLLTERVVENGSRKHAKHSQRVFTSICRYTTRQHLFRCATAKRYSSNVSLMFCSQSTITFRSLEFLFFAHGQ